MGIDPGLLFFAQKKKGVNCYLLSLGGGKNRIYFSRKYGHPKKLKGMEKAPNFFDIQNLSFSHMPVGFFGIFSCKATGD